MNERKAYYWLSLSGMSAKKLCAMLSVYAPLEIWDRIRCDISLQRAIGEANTAELLITRDEKLLDKNLDKLNAKNIRVLTCADGDYPEALKQSEVCPPMALYAKGDISVLNQPCIAIVGTRASSRYGKETAESFARGFALSGVTVVSGMATGIDTFAHGAALDCGFTCAVLGGGFDHVSPYALSLFDRITGKGSVAVTEYAPSFVPTRYSFPERNRIISGLSRATVVIEAAERSGALITAGFALDQNREVYAVPGNIDNPKSVGCNNLIKNGTAAVAMSYLDVLSDLRLKTATADKKKRAVSLDIFDEKIYNLLQSGEKHFDELVPDAGITPAELNAKLFSLELKGVIKKLAGNIYKLA